MAHHNERLNCWAGILSAAVLSIVLPALAAPSTCYADTPAITRGLEVVLDQDNDGVEDHRETIDGTNPSDADSVISHNSGEYCVDWNGFISSLTQVFEVRNAGCSTVSADITLRDGDGITRGATQVTLSPATESDVIVNQLQGFEANNYGTVCAKITSGDPDTLDTQLSVYSVQGNSFHFGYSNSKSQARTGSQYVGYNFYFPTLQIKEVDNAVESYVQITNEEPTREEGVLVYFDADGTQLGQSSIVSLPARGRRDLSARPYSVEPGLGQVGAIEWRPTLATKKFRVSLSRYFHNATSLDSEKIAAVSIPAARPSGAILGSIVDTRTHYSVLEITNTLSSAVQAPVLVYDQTGSLTDSQPGTILIPAKGTRHVVVNSFLPSGFGKVQVQSSEPQALVTNLFEYTLDSSQRLTSVSATAPAAGLGSFQRASYNNFLGGCWLRLANLSAESQYVSVSMKRFDGTTLPLATPVNIPANASSAVNVCASDLQAGYGEVLVTPSVPEAITGDIVRSNRDESAELHSALSDRGVCVAGLTNSPPRFVLSAESGDLGYTNVTNTSFGVTARDVHAVLPITWSDVAQDSSDCATIAPRTRCQIHLTPGNTQYPDTVISIQGSNATGAKLTIGVAPPLTATLSTTPGTLALSASSGTAGIITVTNTSSRATASNVYAALPGTWTDVIQDSSGCVTLTPGGTCQLSFTPGSAQYPDTAVEIKGRNAAGGSVTIGVGAPPNVMLTTTPSTLLLNASNGATGTLTVTNTSSSRAAVNVHATLPGTWTDVTQDASNCTAIAPGASCQLHFTAGNTQYADEFVPIQGTNATGANVTIGVGAPLPSTLSASVSFVGLQVSGNPRVVTITNSSAALAQSVGYSVSPALPAGTTITPGSCGDIAAAGTCVLTVTPGATPSASPGDTNPTPVTINISGPNTNTVTPTASVLTYGSVYQSGYIFALDDSTPTDGSVGGKVAALTDQAVSFSPGSNWSADQSGNLVEDYIPGIDETSTIPGQACNGAIDGACNSARIIDYYSYPNQTVSTPLSYYSAGLCKNPINAYSDWYLPSICEMASDVNASGSGCGTSGAPATENMQSNLVDNGDIGGLSSYYYLSSTEFSSSPTHTVWAMFFSSSGGIQFATTKGTPFGVRCARKLTF